MGPDRTLTGHRYGVRGLHLVNATWLEMVWTDFTPGPEDSSQTR